MRQYNSIWNLCVINVCMTLILFGRHIKANEYSITTVAGRGQNVGENVAPTSSYLESPRGVWGDPNGAIYFAATNRIRIISEDFSTISTYAGNGYTDNYGDGGQASSAALRSPFSVFVDTGFETYIADPNRIKKVDEFGIISTYAGDGGSDDGVPANLELDSPEGVWGNTNGDIFITDEGNCAIQKIVDGFTVNFAGYIGFCGIPEEGYKATSMSIFYPYSVWEDDSKNVYITQQGGHLISRVDSSGILHSFAGGTGSVQNDNIAATSTYLAFPTCIFGISSTVYFCDGDRIRKISLSTHIIALVAGSGTLTNIGAATSMFISAGGFWMDTNGVSYFSDQISNTILKLSVGGTTSILAGGLDINYGGDGGLAVDASLQEPDGVWVNTVADIYVADPYNYAVRKVDHTTNIISVVLGNYLASFSDGNGPATSISISMVNSIWGDSLNNHLYAMDFTSGVVRRISVATNYQEVVAGNFNGMTSQGDSGKATSASFNYAGYLFGNSIGDLYISETNKIRFIAFSTQIITTIAGNSDSLVGENNGVAATSSNLVSNFAVWVNSVGDYYVWDNAKIRKIYHNSGIIFVYVGGGNSETPITDAAALNIAYDPNTFMNNGLWGDTSGNLIVSDYFYGVVYTVDIYQGITVIAGTGGTYYDADSADSLIAYLDGPSGIVSDINGNCYFAEQFSKRIRKLVNLVPTVNPTTQPSISPSEKPSISPSVNPSTPPTKLPTVAPSITPSCTPSVAPSISPTIVPTVIPSQLPSVVPTINPTFLPSVAPSVLPSVIPTIVPTAIPSQLPSVVPTINPTFLPSVAPSVLPSVMPTIVPTVMPSVLPTVVPSVAPSIVPTITPSVMPTISPTLAPSLAPTVAPTNNPSNSPSVLPTNSPTTRPSVEPTFSPTNTPDVYSLATVAGRGVEVGENVSPTSTYIETPVGVWGDTNGNIFFSSSNRIRKINYDYSNVVTVAGNGFSSNYAYGGRATSLSLSNPKGIFVDPTSDGDILFADTALFAGYFSISDGYLNIYAGGGSTDDGSDPLDLDLMVPFSIWGDGGNNKYILDYGWCSVFKIENNVAAHFAGSPHTCGTFGDGMDATSAGLSAPYAVWGDTNDNIYITQDDGYIRVVDSSGTIFTYAGGGDGPENNVAATSTQLINPSCIFGQGGFIYFCNEGYIRSIAASSTVVTQYVGGGTESLGAATSVQIYTYGFWLDTNGLGFIADQSQVRILKLESGIITLLGGGNSISYGGDGGLATMASLNAPQGVWVNNVDDIYIADPENYVIRKVDHSTDIIATVLGTHSLTTGDTSGAATSIGVGLTYSMWGDSLNSKLYVSDVDNCVIRRISLSSNFEDIYAGNFAVNSNGDNGPATSAALFLPEHIFGNSNGGLYVSERFKVRYIPLLSHVIRTLAGNDDPIGVYQNGIAATASLLENNQKIWVDSIGDFYFWDSHSDSPVVRKVFTTSTGYIDVIVGGGISYTTFTGANALDISFDYNTFHYNGISGSTTGNLYLSDYYSGYIFTASYSTQYITIIAGNGFAYYDADNANSLDASLYNPSGLFVDYLGNCYLAESTSKRTRKLINLVPTLQPTVSPSIVPTKMPTTNPTVSPSNCPSVVPSILPSIEPSTNPSVAPSAFPTIVPTASPTLCPTMNPSCDPTIVPSIAPSNNPSLEPTVVPSVEPTINPSVAPSLQPTISPSVTPSICPTICPSEVPSISPTEVPTTAPTVFPSIDPTESPSFKPTYFPSSQPSSSPTTLPSNSPSTQPSCYPSSIPSMSPSNLPSSRPSFQPSSSPTSLPSGYPTSIPSLQPSRQPSIEPTCNPTSHPSAFPTIQPTFQPSSRPSNCPTMIPTAFPTVQPSVLPSMFPSSQPTCCPSRLPSRVPTSQPSVAPSHQPTSNPTVIPLSHPSTQPTTDPSCSPSNNPSCQPSGFPSIQPSVFPSSNPTNQPTFYPSSQPSSFPSPLPSNCPTCHPSGIPTSQPSIIPICRPTSQPSINPSCFPSKQPSSNPSSQPTMIPSTLPSSVPSTIPSLQPSIQPTSQPTSKYLAPEMTFWITNISSNSLTVQADVSNTAIVYCVAAASKLSTPVSTNEIISKGSSGATNSMYKATIVIDALSAVTNYRIFCLAQSLLGGTTSLDVVLRNPVPVTTYCCKEISVTTLRQVSIADQATVNFLSISLSALPTKELILDFTVVSNGNVINNAIIPSKMSITAAASMSWKASLSALPKGEYSIKLAASSDSLSEFTLFAKKGMSIVIFTTNLTVNGVNDLLPPPIFDSAIFDSSGAYLILSFSSETNKGNLSSIFSCNVLFNFTCAESSTCQWSSSSVVNAFVTTEDYCAAPGSSVTLLTLVAVTAKCQSILDNCLSYTSVASSTIVIQPPKAAIPPYVSVSVPSTIGSCDSLTIDISGSSGHGGRSWSVVSFSLKNADNSDVIQDFLNSVYEISPPTAIPNTMLVKGITYGFLLTLCNFLDKCSTQSFQVAIANTVVPVVVLPGSASRYVYRKKVFSLSSSTSISTCEGFNETSLDVQYSWVVSIDGMVQSLSTISKDSSKMLLPGFSLTIGDVYTFSLTVSIADMSTSTSSVLVLVQQGAIVPVLSCESSLLVRYGDENVIDASLSYDEDIGEQIGSDLNFIWTCSQVSPVLNDSCDSIFEIFDYYESFFEFIVMSRDANISSLVSVTVTDSKRNAETSVTVTVIQSDAPLLTISSNTLNGVINSKESLILTGIVSLPSHSSCNAVWHINDSTIDIKQRAISPIVTPLVSGSSYVDFTLYLVLSANSLPTLGWTGLFSLSCQLSSGLSVTSSVVIIVNASPMPGSFAVYTSNDDGTSMLVASRWTDVDLPLQYQFGFVSITGQNVTVVSKSEVSFASAIIPHGLQNRNYSVVCFVNIFDSLSNNASASQSVQILPTNVDIIAKLNSVVLTVDLLRQSIAFVTNSLNFADCSLAPNCSDLKRISCSTTTHTCGSCLPGYFGVDEDSNTPCLESDTFTDDCFGDNCVSPDRTCLNDCFGQGDCHYFEVSTGVMVNSCSITNSACGSKCVCYSGWYGDDCSYDLDSWSNVISTRDAVINLIGELQEKEDCDEQTLSSWVISLNDAAHSSSELSQKSIAAILELSEAHIMLAVDLGVETGVVDSALSSIDNAAQACYRNSNLSIVSSLTYVLDLYVDLVNSKIVPTQEVTSILYPTFRGVVQALAYNSESISESLPQNALESHSSKPSSSIRLPFAVNNSDDLKVTFYSISSNLYYSVFNQSLKSDPVTIKFSSSPCVDCNIILTLPFTSTLTNFDLQPNAPEFSNITCIKKIITGFNHTCIDGFVQQLTCNGTEEGLKIQQCPITRYAPVCNTLIEEETFSDCSVVSYNNESVICSCPTISLNRRLTDNSTDDSGSYSVNYVAMLVSVQTSFVSTIQSAQGLNNSTLRGWRVIVTISVFTGFMLIALYLANMLDARECLETKKKVERVKIGNKSTIASKFSIVQMKKSSSAKLAKARSNRDFQQNHDLMIIDQALPSVFSSQTLSDKVIKELKQHHRWFAIIFFYCKNFPRVLRVLSLFTNIVIMLFIQSLTYTLTNGDDGSCETLTTKRSCLAEMSPYATGQSKCFWQQNTKECHYVTPNGNAKIIVFVAIFSALLSTPLALLVDWLVHHILAASTRSAGRLSIRNSQIQPIEGFSRVVDMENALHHNNRESTTDKENKISNLVKAQKTLRLLTLEIQTYRSTLTTFQLKEFDTLWGLDTNGNFYSAENSRLFKKKLDVKKLLIEDLCNVHTTFDIERQKFLTGMNSDVQRGRRLLFLFQRDLLPGIQGQMLEAKSKRDNILPKSTRLELKIAAWIFIAILNAGMLFYILLFALNESSHQQGAWFQSFVLWLCLEVFFVSTAIVILTHILIPMWTMKDVNKIKQTLLNTLQDFRESVAQRTENSDDDEQDKFSQVVTFSATNYLFVSSQIAKEFPSLKESQIISRFTTPWPKRSYQHVTDVSKQYSKKFSAIVRSFMLVFMYFMTTAISLPAHIQDMIMQSIATISIGYVVLLHIQLFDIFPVLVVVPILVCGILVHFLIRMGNSTAKQKLNALSKVSSSSNISTTQTNNSTRLRRTAHRKNSKKHDILLTTDEFLTDGKIHHSSFVTRRQSVQEGIAIVNKIQEFQDCVEEKEEFVEDHSCDDCTQAPNDEIEDSCAGNEWFNKKSMQFGAVSKYIAGIIDTKTSELAVISSSSIRPPESTNTKPTADYDFHVASSFANSAVEMALNLVEKRRARTLIAHKTSMQVERKEHAINTQIERKEHNELVKLNSVRNSTLTNEEELNEGSSTVDVKEISNLSILDTEDVNQLASEEILDGSQRTAETLDSVIIEDLLERRPWCPVLQADSMDSVSETKENLQYEELTVKDNLKKRHIFDFVRGETQEELLDNYKFQIPVQNSTAYVNWMNEVSSEENESSEDHFNGDSGLGYANWVCNKNDEI